MIDGLGGSAETRGRAPRRQTALLFSLLRKARTSLIFPSLCGVLRSSTPVSHRRNLTRSTRAGAWIRFCNWRRFSRAANPSLADDPRVQSIRCSRTTDSIEMTSDKSGKGRAKGCLGQTDSSLKNKILLSVTNKYENNVAKIRHNFNLFGKQSQKLSFVS